MHDSMVHDHIERLTELETVQKMHTISINTLTNSLDQLSKSFIQIKWSIYGAVGLYTLNIIGFVDFIKRVL